MTRRRTRVVIGGLLAALGMLGIARPGLFRSVPGTASLVTIAGVCAIAAGLYRLSTAAIGRRRTIDLSRVADEREAPGTDFDRALRNRSERVRDRLSTTLRRALSSVDGDDSETDEAVRSGSWTDDPLAAGLFTRTVAADGGQATVRETFRTNRARLGRQVDRVLQELERVTGLRSPDDPATGAALSSPEASAVTSVDPPDVGETVFCATERWAGIDAVTLLLVGIGVVAREPRLLLVGVVGATVATGVRVSVPPRPSLEVERHVSATSPAPGEEVTVTVRLRNTGRWPRFDVTYADGVPPGLSVVDDTPTVHRTVWPGEEVTATYTLRASPGVHEFDPGYVRTRDVFGAAERAERTTAGATTVTCLPRLDPLSSFPLRKQTSGPTGLVPTDVGGEGVEFYSIREYRPGDPISRIDWRQYARGRDLATVEYREARSATVVVAIDARGLARGGLSDADPSPFDAGVTGAGRVFATLLSSGNRVGVAALTASLTWLAPGAGREHRERGRAFLADVAGARDPGENVYPPIRALRERLPEDAQIVLFSSVVDDAAADAARTLDAYGHRVTVVSPDPGRADSPGRRLRRIERQLRLAELRRAGVHVAEWSLDEPLEAAVTRMEERR